MEKIDLNTQYWLRIWGENTDLNGFFSLKCRPVPIGQIIIEFLHIDGRPRFAKHSIDDSTQIEIAAIDPDF